VQVHSNQHRFAQLAALVMAACLMAPPGSAQTARQSRGAAAVEPIANEPAGKIVVDPPLAEPLSRGLVVIQYRTDNLHITPVFGAAALAVSPRIGHIHVSLDDASWVWADASGEPVILNGLTPGPHKVLLQLESANHQELDRGAVQFRVPKATHPGSTHGPESRPASDTAPSHATEPPAKIIIDAPSPERLARGVVFVEYRTQHLQIVPVYGLAALAVSPRVGHIHVTVDDATWHWADASGNPVIINGLLPGPHKVLIQLVNADHQSIDEGTVRIHHPTTESVICRRR
jgi:hypothetical protein